MLSSPKLKTGVFNFSGSTPNLLNPATPVIKQQPTGKRLDPRHRRFQSAGAGPEPPATMRPKYTPYFQVESPSKPKPKPKSKE